MAETDVDTQAAIEALRDSQLGLFRDARGRLETLAARLADAQAGGETLQGELSELMFEVMDAVETISTATLRHQASVTETAAAWLPTP